MLIPLSFPGQQIWHKAYGTLSKQLLRGACACNLLFEEQFPLEELTPDKREVSLEPANLL